MSRSGVLRWLVVAVLVLAFDALVWVFAGLVFVHENCEGRDYWACREIVRTTARTLLYSTPFITLIAMFAGVYAWIKRRRVTRE